MDWQSMKDLKKKKFRPIIQAKNLTKQERKKNRWEVKERGKGGYSSIIQHLIRIFEENIFFLDFFVDYLSSLVQNLSIEAHRTTDRHCKINLI